MTDLRWGRGGETLEYPPSGPIVPTGGDILLPAPDGHWWMLEAASGGSIHLLEPHQVPDQEIDPT